MDETKELNQKELYDTKKQAKEKEIKSFQRKKLVKRGILWVLVILVVGGALFGLVKLGSSGNPGKNQSAVLANAVSAGDWKKGDEQAKVFLVEYADFQCPACKIYHGLLQELLKNYEGKVSLVFRYFPLRQIHANAEGSSRAAQAAGLQGKFWEMHDLIFEGQTLWSNQSKPKATETFIGYAEKLDLDVDKFKKDLDSDVVKNAVERDYQGGLKSGVNATPTFFLNGQKIQPVNYENFKSLLDQTIAAGS